MGNGTSKIARDSRTTARAWWAPVGVVALATIAASTGIAAEASSPAAKGSPTAAGQTFRVYCASCHGTGGAGDGPIAPTLLTKPTDLTRLAEKNDGVFPKERVLAVIDGRELVATHGPREMPVWGDTFVWPEEDSPERRAEVQRKIDGLVTLLESMQKKKPAAPKS